MEYHKQKNDSNCYEILKCLAIFLCTHMLYIYECINSFSERKFSKRNKAILNQKKVIFTYFLKNFFPSLLLDVERQMAHV